MMFSKRPYNLKNKMAANNNLAIIEFNINNSKRMRVKNNKRQIYKIKKKWLK